jgi:hypothetical protein
MPSFIDHSGQRFGRWTVLSYSHMASCGSHWHCRCDCGTEKTVRGQYLREGRSTGCGCTRRVTHGLHKHPQYGSWLQMRDRCRNPNHPDYPHYGGRGIKVCKRWHDFGLYLSDVGERPPGKTLDRIDNDGNYTPGNVRWATQKEQIANRRLSRVRNSTR